MTERIQAIRGMNDVLPDATPLWRTLEQVFIHVLTRYGYQEIRFPLVESTQLFKRTIGEVTDIVEKEMYTFNDLNGDSITLRPEGTAGCVRACLEHGLLHNQQQKLWYMGPMFRHERPQKGRYRQFNQLGVEAFGMSGAMIELELISICRKFWEQLGFDNLVQLQVNTLGELSERHHYKKVLVEYLLDHENLLDEDSKRRLDRNPLRILDSKNPEMHSLLANAPKLIDVLGEKSRAHFKSFCDGLDTLNISYEVNPVLVRGLDYYGHTVFEWVTDKLGSQATVCAGGRYDILVEQLGGNRTPAAGFALGIERIYLLMETLNLLKQEEKKNTIYIIATNDQAVMRGLKIAESIRNGYPKVEVLVNTAGGSFKSQFKKADKSGAHFALILGDDEMIQEQIGIKNLRSGTEQITVKQNMLHQVLKDYLE
ncbi:histidine--tRNA ligase [Legionella longbeachae]|uniref:Histidine--tRNA ligase n=2 Tax=Legionella longbeachae TaxID=450 RepID=D3HSL1_LEGLN|nr:histidine--tRNA ligase [Legionella longbeachae]VEE02394.1 histidyl-tRNA synthetase [Legionella oakridgensis]HBD7398115.1 histidine--tRNA ligase [Legionella pneumophila]ARB91325.1 histidine--tRNA ligase [Legionella longbeachae]ARM32251.1 histidine--tRNA ligase [Legionella longbeachae]EEZ94966.1 histidyl-tRNA synthetase [Legionella longbeachae D-4968]